MPVSETIIETPDRASVAHTAPTADYSDLPTPAPHFVHLPTPGDHYSAATGSAVMTVIYEMSRCHADAGGQTTVLVSQNTRHDYPVGKAIEYEGRPLPDLKRKLVNAVLGAAGLPRYFDTKAYAPSLESLDRDFDGVIFLHNAAGAVRSYRKKYSRARIFLWPHNNLFGTYTDREVRRTIGATDGVICVSQFIANKIATRLGDVMGDKLRVVNNGVDAQRFRPASRKRSEGIPVVLFVGRVTAQKAPDLLIKAAVNLVSPARKFKLRIVGNSGFSAKDPLTPYELELRELAKPLGEMVEFQSFVDRNKLIDEFDAASIYCVPSNWDDPCPLTVGEGLASGMPCVFSRRGGIPEVASDAAFMFDPPDVDTLGKHLAYLIDNASARDEWGYKARDRAIQVTWAQQYKVLRTQCDVGTFARCSNQTSAS